MSLINADLEKSSEEKAKDAVRIINAKLDESFKNIIVNAKSIFDLVWHDKELSPEQIFAALGTSAVKLMQISIATQSFVNSLKADSLSLVPLKSITPHEDGSIELGE